MAKITVPLDKAYGCRKSTMGQFRIRQRTHKSSHTPGKGKGPTCVKTTVGGMPRSFWMRSRSYKHRNYAIWCDFQNKVN